MIITPKQEGLMKPFTQFMAEAQNAPNIQTVAHENYGQEMVIDIHEVPDEFFTKKNVRQYAEKLCDEIDMKRGPIYVWGKESELHTHPTGEGAIKADGLSCIQFLYSSSIVIHALDEIKKVFVNIFSWNQFDVEKARKFTEEHIGGKIINVHNIVRK